MNERLLEIQKQLELLSSLIKEFLYTSEKERIVIEKEDFKYIRHIGKLNSYLHVFEYLNDIVFPLANSSSYPYDFMHYSKLMSGELERIVLIKADHGNKIDGKAVNYKLEPLEKTRLFDLYPNQ